MPDSCCQRFLSNILSSNPCFHIQGVGGLRCRCLGIGSSKPGDTDDDDDEDDDNDVDDDDDDDDQPALQVVHTHGCLAVLQAKLETEMMTLLTGAQVENFFP